MKGRKGSVGTLNSKDSKTRTTSSGFRAAAKLAVGSAKGRARAASTAAANDITPPPPPTPVAAPTRSKIVAINVAMNARAPFLAWLRTRGWRQLKPLPGVLKLQSLCATHGAQAMALGAPMATPNAPLAYDVVLASARFVSRKSAFGVLSDAAPPRRRHEPRGAPKRAPRVHGGGGYDVPGVGHCEGKRCAAAEARLQSEKGAVVPERRAICARRGRSRPSAQHRGRRLRVRPAAQHRGV